MKPPKHISEHIPILSETLLHICSQSKGIALRSGRGVDGSNAIFHSLSFSTGFIFWVLRFEPRVLHLLDRCSTTWATPPPRPCCFSYFSNRCFMSILAWTVTLLFVSHVDGMTSTCHHALLLLTERGSCELFLFKLDSNHDPPNSHFPSS
jgi:hypothetical protein